MACNHCDTLRQIGIDPVCHCGKADMPAASAVGTAKVVASSELRPGLVDMVNHPPHYTGHPSGVECIRITEHMGFCLGNAVKYIWRADLKADAIEDLKKARWYLDREIQRRESTTTTKE